MKINCKNTYYKFQIKIKVAIKIKVFAMFINNLNIFLVSITLKKFYLKLLHSSNKFFSRTNKILNLFEMTCLGRTPRPAFRGRCGSTRIFGSRQNTENSSGASLLLHQHRLLRRRRWRRERLDRIFCFGKDKLRIITKKI